MGKSIAIKLAILLVVASLAYGVFWFFKVGQVEKQINKFVSDNSSYISVGEIAVSGFPLNQKITVKNLKFSIPNSALDKNEIMVPHLEATAGIMDSQYKISLVENPSVQDVDGNISNVEFTQSPDIKISIAGGNITSFDYQDSGYKIIGQDKAVSYSASASTISIKSDFGLEKITHNISANISEIEGFAVINLYKNILEKKIIDGIKTGEVALNNAASAQNTTAPTSSAEGAPNAVPAIENSAATPTVDNSATTQATPAAQPTPAPVAAPTAAPATTNPMPTNTVDATNANPSTTTAVAAAPEQNTQQNPESASAVPQPAAAPAATKGNLTLSLEYVLTPAQNSGQEANTPPDPTQIVEAPSQYNKMVKISSLEYTNSAYKISVSGELSSLPDDNLPSGGITIKIEKIDALISQLSNELTQIAQKMKPVAEAKPATEVDPQQQALSILVPPAPIEDPYQTFLTRISAGLNPVAKEIAAKNAVTKDEIAQFDLRREKNLDFLVNETPIHEILGKF